MPERAGPANQSGVLYQNTIAALFLARMCDPGERPAAEHVVRIRVEAPTDVDDIVLQFADGHRCFIQAKESIAARSAAWSGMWNAFARQFTGADFKRGEDQLAYYVGRANDHHDQIGEIAERARSTSSAEEWRQRLSQSGLKILGELGAAVAAESAVLVDFALQHALFAHIHVTVWSRRHIERELVPIYCAGANTSPETLFRLLRDRIGGQASLRQAFDAVTLRRELFDADQVEFRAAPSMARIRDEFRSASALLRQHKRTFGRTGVHLSRSITNDIVAWAEAPEPTKTVGLLLDHAGSGKSSVLRDVLEALEHRGIAVLGLKADQQCADVLSSDDLQQRLGLSCAPERAVAHLAAAGRVVVLVDQVDALSLSLARDQAALNLVLDLVGRIRQLPNVSILLSCRTFDRNTDPRLHRLEVGREFVLAPLDQDEITQVLARVRIEYSALSASTAALLSTPLHLDLFASLAERAGERAANLRGVTSLQGLYGLLWDEAVLRVEPDGPTPAARVEVLSILTAQMHERQQTTVARATVPATDAGARASATQWLASAGVIIPLGPNWGYLHQTFFDYCFARFFVEANRDLVEFILASDQGLFVRSQIIHVLAFLRGTGHPSYLRSVQHLLTEEALRPHLRTLVWHWFGALPDPSQHEWDLKRRLLYDDQKRVAALRAMHGNPAWLAYLHGPNQASNGVLRMLLERPTAEIEADLLPYFGSLIDLPDAQAAVCAMVGEWFQRPTPWLDYACHLTKRIRHWLRPEARALYASFVAQVPLDHRAELHQLDDLAKLDPAFAAEMLGVVFARFRVLFSARETPEDRLRGLDPIFAAADTYPITETLRIASDMSPVEFLRVMLAFVHQVLDDEATYQASLSGRADGVDEHDYPNDPLSSLWAHDSAIRDGLLDGIVRALVKAHCKNAPLAEDELDRLAERPFITAQELVARTLRELLPTSAMRAAAFLAGDARRLRLGDDSLLTRRLLRDLAPYITSDAIEHLQSLILRSTGRVEWRARWNDGASAVRRRGLDQLHLLRAIPASGLTAESRDRLGELERKFPDHPTLYQSTRSECGWVGSPIDDAALDKMSDAALVGAMGKCSGAATHATFLRGGARELANALQPRIKADPIRFHRLFMRVPPSVDFRYVEAALKGLSESEGDPELLFEIMRRFVLVRPTQALGPRIPRTVAWALDAVIGRHQSLPGDILDALEATARGPIGEDEQAYLTDSGRMDSATLNTDRSCALLTAVRALLLGDTNPPPARIWSVLESMVPEPSPVLKAAAVESLTYLLRHDRARATWLFEEMVASMPALCTFPEFHRFLYYAAHRQFGRLLPYVEAMLESDDPKTRGRGAELATLGHIADSWMEDETAMSDVDRVAARVCTGDDAMRAGAARIYAYNWQNHRGDRCAAGLLRLGNDPDADVRREVARVAYELREEDLLGRRAFLVDFADSHAAMSAHRELAEFLWIHAATDPAAALKVGERLAQNAHTEDGSHRHREGTDLIRLALRVYTDPLAEPSLRGRAMDLFDRLLVRYTWDAQQALSEWDRI